jgi:hypothetical protein
MEVSETIKGYTASLDLGNGRLLDCYELPSGEKRVGFAGTSVALGYSKEWFGRLATRGKKLLKALQEEGYNGLEVTVSSETRGKTVTAKTISVRDFVKVVGQDAIVNRNPKSITLLVAFAEVGIEKVINDLFTGNNTDYLLQKIEHYSQWTQEDLEAVLAYNREDARSLRLG